MKNSSPRTAALLAFFLLAFLCIPAGLHAMDSGTGSASTEGAGGSGALSAPRAKEWKLGISLFTRLASLPDASFVSFDDLPALRGTSVPGGEQLASSLPELLREALEPLPRFRSELGDTAAAAAAVKGAGEVEVSEGTVLRLVRPSSGAMHFDPADGMSEAATLDGFIFGVYVRKGEHLAIAMYLVEAGRLDPATMISWEGSFESLDGFAPAVVPRIAAWAAGRKLAIVDFFAQGPGMLTLAALTGMDDKSAASFELQKSRVFLYREESIGLTASMAGHESLRLEVQARKMGTMGRQQVSLARQANVRPPSEKMSIAAADLAWAGEERFGKAERGFRNSLTRFILSLPVSILCAGWFVTVNQAWASYGASDAALYASGATAGTALALSLGFFVDLSLRLADVLAAAR